LDKIGKELNIEETKNQASNGQRLSGMEKDSTESPQWTDVLGQEEEEEEPHISYFRTFSHVSLNTKHFTNLLILLIFGFRVFAQWVK
jgi:hypothetical protein